MARCAERPDDDGNSSLISDVFDFVSRELNQFVATATGGSVAANVSSHRHSQLQQNSSHMCSSGHQFPDDSLPSNSAVVEAVDHNKQAPSLYPHKHVSTMPGALFPRSPTSEPDSLPHFEQCIVAAPVPSHHITGETSGRKTRKICQSIQSRENKPESVLRSDIVTSEGPETRLATDGEILDGEGQRSQGCIRSVRLRGDREECRNSVLDYVDSGKGEQEQGLRHIEEERSRDKEKIRCLEDEIRKLKEELSKKDITPILPPPAPPPPPIRDDNIRNSNSMSSKFSDPLSLIASARAALKRAPTPVEVPINPCMSTKRQGLPAIGVPPDKMAAFLNELKNVRLRKVRQSSKQASSMANVSANSSVSTDSHLSFGDPSALSDRIGVNSTLSTSANPAFNFIDLSSVRAGSKRKREFPDDPQRHSSWNKMGPTIPIVRAQLPTHSGSSSAIAITASGAGDNMDTTFGNWPSIYSTDVTTPSLVSDNDHERDDISSIEHIPRTPPEALPEALHHIEQSRERPEIIDVDAYVERRLGDVTREEKLQNSSSSQKPAQAPYIVDLLSRRAPTSPLPNDSPRKPFPPSKILRSPRQAKDGGGSARHSMRWRTRLQRWPEKTSLLPIRNVWQNTSPHTTLDEELRRAVKSLESIGTEPILDDEECGILTGTGIREKTDVNDNMFSMNGINTRHLSRIT
ncbi:hypothetical protein APHAL10511_004580 [Amanita phalloides]|nr:hypothetical protein APHAL10511_004580 [Amanita phalloides]